MGARVKFRMSAAPQALQRSMGFVLNRVALLFRQRSAAKLAELGLTMQKYAVLCCLAEFGASSQKDIAARTGIDPSDLVPMLDTLQEEIHVSRDRDDADLRCGEVRIVDAGEQLLMRAAKQLSALEDQLFAGLSAGERLHLCQLIARVVS